GLQPVHAAGRHRAGRRDSVHRADGLRRGQTLRTKRRNCRARRESGDGAGNATLSETSFSARRCSGGSAPAKAFRKRFRLSETVPGALFLTTTKRVVSRPDSEMKRQVIKGEPL